jgi:hypothetical protein
LIVAAVVPWVTFRLALRQDQVRWLRERRAEVYVDLLTEAHAEHDYFLNEILDPEIRERYGSGSGGYVDLRLPRFERARLGSRGTIFASRNVNRLFNQLQHVALVVKMFERPKDEGQRAVARVRVGQAFEELQDAIRDELGADRILLGEPRPTVDRRSQPDAQPPST